VTWSPMRLRDSAVHSICQLGPEPSHLSTRRTPAMALMNKGVQMITERMPKVISPRTRAILDYSTAAGFFLGAALFWRSHKRAAIASLACGIAEAGTAMMTDYPGGVAD